MKKYFSLLLFLVLFAMQGFAQQNYKTSLGLRLGWSYGFTVKHFFTPKMAFEGIVSTRYFGGRGWGNYKKGWWGRNDHGVNLTALLEWHFPIGKVQGFNWFIGGGLHVGTWRGYSDHPYYPGNRWFMTLGLDAIGGVEYTFAKIPLTLQADLKPSINFAFGGRFYPGFDEIGISARYAIK